MTSTVALPSPTRPATNRVAVKKRRPRGQTVISDGQWWQAQGRRRRSGEPLRQLGKPGLWRLIRDGSGLLPVFEVPLSLALSMGQRHTGSEDRESLAAACSTWASETAGGKLSTAWQAPSRQEAESWLDDDLVVRRGKSIRQGELICSDERLAIRVPVLHRVPLDLAPERQAWLEEVLMEGQDDWRLVRIGLNGVNGSTTAEAEVDLTGAPHDILQELLQIALSSLRQVVEWLMSPVDFIADASVACQAMEIVSPVRQKTAERSS